MDPITRTIPARVTASNLSPRERLLDNPGLGLLSRLPKELRDGIWDLCTQEKHYEVDEYGPFRFQVHAPLSHLRLVSKAFTLDYESHAPANAIMMIGSTLNGYTFQLGHNAPKHVQWPKHIQSPTRKLVTPPGNLKSTTFEIAGFRTETPKSPWYLVNMRPRTPAGTFGLVLRFFQDPRADLAGFMRVFDDFRVSWTCRPNLSGSLISTFKPAAMQLHDVMFLLSGHWETRYMCDTLPEVGTRTPEGGFEFNDAPDGILLGYSKSDDDTWVERRDYGL